MIYAYLCDYTTEFYPGSIQVLCYTLCVLLQWLLDKDGELVWEQLTVEEREGFQKMLSDGRIGHLLDSYTPWWKVKSILCSLWNNFIVNKSLLLYCM